LVANEKDAIDDEWAEQGEGHGDDCNFLVLHVRSCDKPENEDDRAEPEGREQCPRRPHGEEEAEKVEEETREQRSAKVPGLAVETKAVWALDEEAV
jgi:hypothetical protein